MTDKNNGVSREWKNYRASKVLSLVSHCIDFGKKNKSYLNKKTIIDTLQINGISFAENPKEFFNEMGINHIDDLKPNDFVLISAITTKIRHAETPSDLFKIQKVCEELSDNIYPY